MPKFPYDYYYGVEIDTVVANPQLKRLGRPELHVALPIQSRMRRCLLKDDGTVNYYLHANDSALRDNGAAADLTGADGQVMVEIPEHWRKFEFEGTKWRVFLSEFELPGFHRVPKAYRSAYEAAVDRTTGSYKLCSVVNAAPAFRGGDNNADWDGTYRSLLGRPAASISLTNFRAYARNRGAAGKSSAGWSCDLYDIQKTCYWLYVVEYANLNCQAAYNAQPTGEGYRQGGLGSGVTEVWDWYNFNGYHAFIPCGHANSLGNRTGLVDFTMPAEYSASLTVQVPSYRGLENPFVHLWSWTDGCKIRVSPAAANGGAGLSEFFVCSDPSKLQDSSYSDYEKRGNLPRNDGYVKEMLIGEFGENMPKVTSGASSTTYFSDYHYQYVWNYEVMAGVLFGGAAADGAGAGFACAYTAVVPSIANSYVGSRLCFIPV
jgi:hypothetical protein